MTVTFAGPATGVSGARRVPGAVPGLWNRFPIIRLPRVSMPSSCRELARRGLSRYQGRIMSQSADLAAPAAARQARYRRAGVHLGDGGGGEGAGGFADDGGELGRRQLGALSEQQGGDAGDLGGGQGAAGEEIVGAVGHGGEDVHG